MASARSSFVSCSLLGRKVAVRARRGWRRGRSARHGVGLVLVARRCSLLALRLAERSSRRRRGSQPAAPAPMGTRPDEPPDAGYEPEFAWIPVLIVVGLARAGGRRRWWSARPRRRARGELREQPARGGARGRAGRDARRPARRARPAPRGDRRLRAARAVLAAYGLPRDPPRRRSSTSRRMLAELSVAAPAARRLTTLFERAKFSQHEVGPEMKEEAIDALETVRDELRAARARRRAGARRPRSRQPASGRRPMRRLRFVRAAAALLPTIALVVVLLLVLPGRRELVAPRLRRSSSPRIVLGRCSSALRARATRRAGRSRVRRGARARRSRGRAAARARRDSSARCRSASRPRSTSTSACARAAPDRAASCWPSAAGSTSTRDPDAARRALGDETWELVRPDREPPRRPPAPGLDPALAAAHGRRRWRRSRCELAEARSTATPDPRRGRARRRRQARRARARPPRHARRRPRPARGLPGAGEDARRPLLRAGDEHRLRRASSSRPT